MQFPNVRGLNDFFLLWQRRGKEGGNPQVMQRLASPLIVKALPLATGQFCPLALWLDRRFPEAGEVGLSSKASGPLDPKTLAAFDRLVSEEDSPRFLPLEEGRNEVQGHRLRTSFEAWLKKHNKAERIA
jgi:CRISPR-associated protein Cmr1